MVFIEAPRSRDDLARIARAVGAPVLANMVEGGKTPLCTVDELQEMGFAAVLFANTALRVAGYAMREALRDLRQTGTSDAWLPRMLGWDERQAIAGLQEYLDLSSRFAQAGRTRGER
jgi:2-methylisocitrate lyase-like PEP mutase family enzyme